MCVQCAMYVYSVLCVCSVLCVFVVCKGELHVCVCRLQREHSGVEPRSYTSIQEVVKAGGVLLYMCVCVCVCVC